jgi:hypothetical protein
MKFLSIDVGIKNLAFCLFSKEGEQFKVTKWDVINISEEETLKCFFSDKNGFCNKPAKFKKDKHCYCLKHSKKQTLQIPGQEQKLSFINKQKLQKLFEIADSHGVKYEPKVKKAYLINLINNQIQKTYFEAIESKKASDVNMFQIGINIKNKFNEIFKDEGYIDTVIIENQIGPLAIRMKTIQGMIVQYFIMSPLNVNNIEFISAANKLKDCDVKDKEKYSDRKKLGIAKCLGILTDDFRFHEHLDYFNSHKKKDDLADAFLQGMWFSSNSTFGKKVGSY